MATKKNITLTQERLQELLNYCPDTGIFTWKVQTGRVRIDEVAGSLRKGWYRVIKIDGSVYLAHRLAFLYMTGIHPPNEIDHRNGGKDDNRWRNLRPATHAENQQNQKLRKSNTSGFTGVQWYKRYKKWRSRIHVNGREINLGFFDNKEAAYFAYLEAKENLHQFQPVPRQSPNDDVPESSPSSC